MMSDTNPTNQKLLIKCDNSIFADEITDALKENGIASRQRDERCDVLMRQTGIAVYVYTEDYEKASEVIAPIIEERNKFTPMCPKCGSEDVVRIAVNNKHYSLKAVLSIVFILISAVYFLSSKDMLLHNDILDIVAWALLIIGVILMLFTGSNNNYQCKKCGKKFYHVD